MTTLAPQPVSVLGAAEVEARYGVDLTTAEVIRHALEHIGLQMQIKINTAALSPLLSEVNDFGIGLLAPRDLERNLDFDAIAMGTAAPGHYVINQFYARMAIEHWGVENFKPGDVIIFNEPYRGGSHINDVGTLMPIFDDDQVLVGFAAAITHWLDIGGPIPTGFGPGLQRDMYAEGIRLSPRHLYREGQLVRETVELFTGQTRIPDISINDLQVIRSALELGAEMVLRYVNRYGREVYAGAIQYSLDHTERAMRAALSQIPDGDYTAEDYMDNDMDGDTMLIRCTVRKRGGEVEVDYSGSSRNEWGGFACTWSDGVSGAHLGLQVALPDSISPNAGAYRPVHVVLPPGSCLHALPPMATNAGHTMFIAKAINLVKRALSQAEPSMAVAENYDDVLFMSFAGADTRSGVPTPFIFMNLFQGPFGGTALGDGSCYTFQEGGNCVVTSVELDEESFPVLLLQREFVADTAGPGQHRGGPATRSVLVPLADSESSFQLDQCRIGPRGAAGGDPGATGHIVVYRNALDAWASGADLGEPEVLAGIVDDSGRLVSAEVPGATEFRSSKQAGVQIGARDVVVHQTPGAGGCGDPARRDPNAIARDIRNDIVTAGS
ncbi:hydantoinase B/oxoprolinase family protein [[Mycobacterium] burgundiense]|uniref:Hydantoinase B/oxoprolinase family protein n=1 Tax=[Mycobacterium] burgundiense TaxID=3064286 RepID=A0ABM9LUM1_9MYCO|nr:hydantoinase B/oxoprolinase family protein [Mycolicibacterium sp. MU0053]CAJ1505012.1 hydantoinase B/oxoprolinase family protein [Mycolicibacterium sp. MU0053]